MLKRISKFLPTGSGGGICYLVENLHRSIDGSYARLRDHTVASVELPTAQVVRKLELQSRAETGSRDA